MNPSQAILRRAGLSDAAAMTACVTAAYRHYIDRIGKPPGPMLEDYATVVRDHQAFVAANRRHIIGVLVLIPGPDAMLLDNIAVSPDFQGFGVGKRLMILAEEEAKRQGFGEIRLYTHEMMTENIALYQKAGYVEFDRRAEKGYRRIYMRKPLTENICRLPEPSRFAEDNE